MELVHQVQVHAAGVAKDSVDTVLEKRVIHKLVPGDTRDLIFRVVLIGSSDHLRSQQPLAMRKVQRWQWGKVSAGVPAT